MLLGAMYSVIPFILITKANMWPWKVGRIVFVDKRIKKLLVQGIIKM